MIAIILIFPTGFYQIIEEARESITSAEIGRLIGRMPAKRKAVGHVQGEPSKFDPG